MSIIKGKLIFCEGEGGSPDILFWNRVLSIESMRLTIIPMGGKTSAYSFARGYASAQRDNPYHVIRDRDLDEEPRFDEQTPQPIEWNGGKVLLTGYPCLESYFIEPEWVSEFCGGRYTTSELSQKLYDTLYALRDYQAVRWALQSSRKTLNTVARATYAQSGASDSINLPNRWVKDDGVIPYDLALSACKGQAEQLITQAKQLFDDLDLTNFEQTIEAYRSKFDGDAFWNTGYRAWFHGKDVLYHWLASCDNVPIKQFCMYAAQYPVIDFEKHPDLRQICTIVDKP
jgi:hypothetical protein